MKNWVKRNLKTIVTLSFIIPIVIVAIVSISHVTQWYTLTNPNTWAVYLSIGVEIAALSALSAISVNMGKKVYLPFAVVTLLQLIGNVYFSYSFIDVNSIGFKNWVELTSPVLEFTGVESTDIISHKRLLSFFSGGMLPLISLSFLHMLVKFSESKNGENEPDTNRVSLPPKLIYPTKTLERGSGNLIKTYEKGEDKLIFENTEPQPEPLKLNDEEINKLDNFLKNNFERDHNIENDITEEELPQDIEKMEGTVEDENSRFDKENKQRSYSKYTYGNRR